MYWNSSPFELNTRPGNVCRTQILHLPRSELMDNNQFRLFGFERAYAKHRLMQSEKCWPFMVLVFELSAGQKAGMRVSGADTGASRAAHRSYHLREWVSLSLYILPSLSAQIRYEAQRHASDHIDNWHIEAGGGGYTFRTLKDRWRKFLPSHR